MLKYVGSLRFPGASSGETLSLDVGSYNELFVSAYNQSGVQPYDLKPILGTNYFSLSIGETSSTRGLSLDTVRFDIATNGTTISFTLNEYSKIRIAMDGTVNYENRFGSDRYLQLYVYKI